MASPTLRRSDILFRIITYTACGFAFAAIFLPFLYLVVISFSTREEAITRGFYLIPSRFTWNSYGYLINNRNFVDALRSSVYITAIGTVINIVLTVLMAYGLSKPYLAGRRWINFMVLFTMLFSGGIIPTYLVIKGLHLLDSYWSLWLSGAVASFNLIVMRSFFSRFPSELEEAARIDGCKEFRLLWSIVVPLSMPAIMTFILFYLVNNWNTYFSAIIYLDDSAKWPLQVYLRQMLLAANDSSNADELNGFEYGPPVKMAAVLIAALPLLAIYPLFQKYFNKGMLLGSIKG